MRFWLALLTAAALAVPPEVAAQARKAPARRPAPVPPKPITATPEIICPAPLGVGAATKLSFCDVMSGRDPTGGVLIKLPPHQGPVTLTFDLHNRHTYSEEQVKANRAFARYTATIGALTMDNTLISRAVVQSEFRKATDLVDRITGGAGPGGLKAVAPTGSEHITILIPEEELEVSLLGEKLTVERPEGSATYTSPGRPIAVVSNVRIEYLEPPPARPPARKR
jgi:hypothetical protein